MQLIQRQCVRRLADGKILMNDEAVAVAAAVGACSRVYVTRIYL